MKDLKTKIIGSLTDKGIEHIARLSTKQATEDLNKGEKYMGVLAYAAADTWAYLPVECKKELISKIIANGYDTSQTKKCVILDTLCDNEWLLYCIEKSYPPEKKRKIKRRYIPFDVFNCHNI